MGGQMNNLLKAVRSAVQSMNVAEIEGATFLLSTLHDTLKNDWSVFKTEPLNVLAIADVFDKLVGICNSLRTVTQRYKSLEWMNGALKIIDVLRIELRQLEDCARYDKQALIYCIYELLTYADNFDVGLRRS